VRLPPDLRREPEVRDERDVLEPVLARDRDTRAVRLEVDLPRLAEL
jgi:hypothetical protein